MRVRRVPLEMLRCVGDCEWRDTSRGIYVKGSDAFVPVRRGFTHELEIPERSVKRSRGYQRLGNVVVVRGRRPTEEEIARIAEQEHPRGIVHIRAHEGVTRRPVAEVIFGECGDVIVSEHGCRYALNPAKVMFAQGNLVERQRIARLVRMGRRRERIADMCAGIGYFTIPLALAGADVHAMELNPEAFHYLKRNILMNHAEDRVLAEEGDSRLLLDGIYDRFVIGHFDSLSFLPSALEHARRGSIIHLHTIGDARSEIASILRAQGLEFTIAMRRVKKYRPHKWHVVQDVVLE